MSERLARSFTLVMTLSVVASAMSPAHLDARADDQSQMQPQRYERRMFWREEAGRPTVFETESMLIPVSQSAYWYIETQLPQSHLLNYTQDQMDNITSRFETKVLPLLHSAFGFEPLPPSDVDADPRTTILITADLGRFSARNALPVSADPLSNAREMIYVRYELGIESLLGMVAHEFTHLIQSNYDPAEEGWMSEGLAMTAQVWSGFGISLGGWFLANTSAGLWSGRDSTWVDYGGRELLIRYMADHYGAENFTRFLTQDPTRGMASVEEALAAWGNGTTFQSVFRDWLVANLVGNQTTEGDRYRYATPVGRAQVNFVVRGYPWNATVQLLSGGGAAYIRLEQVAGATPLEVTVGTSVDTFVAFVVVDSGESVTLIDATPVTGGFRIGLESISGTA